MWTNYTENYENIMKENNQLRMKTKGNKTTNIILHIDEKKRTKKN